MIFMRPLWFPLTGCDFSTQSFFLIKNLHAHCSKKSLAPVCMDHEMICSPAEDKGHIMYSLFFAKLYSNVQSKVTQGFNSLSQTDPLILQSSLKFPLPYFTSSTSSSIYRKADRHTNNLQITGLKFMLGEKCVIQNGNVNQVSNFSMQVVLLHSDFCQHCVAMTMWEI